MSKPLQITLRHPLSGRQRGVTLIEALVALLIMSFGMIALVGLMSNLRFSADVAKQRSEAMRLAREDLAKARTFAELGPTAVTAGNALYSQIVNQATSTPITPVDSNTTYSVQRFVTPMTDAQAVQVRVAVAWTDRAGAGQTVYLDTIIARVDPLFSAAVGFSPVAGAITQPSARSPAIPKGAKQLDAKYSAFRPSPLSSTVWVFNNLTGIITGKCSIAIATAVSTLTVLDVDTCKNNTVGYLLSGVIRFSNTNPANPTLPEAYALPSLGLSIVSGTYDLPDLNPTTGAPRFVGTVMQMQSPAPTATAPSGTNLPECFNDSPGSAVNTQPFVTYNCIVYPPDASVTAGGRSTWSGKVILTGLTTGITASEYRVCRYSADYNGSGGGFTADWLGLENEEHPAVYGKVSASLTRQNFLVVRGDLSCPTAPAVNFSAGVFADYSTIQLQP